MSILQEAIGIVTRGNSLTREQAAGAMGELMSGEATPAQIGGFLIALSMKGESVEEITGFAETMRAMATPVQTERQPLVDVVGTGGDYAGTFNISTTACFVVAGAGIAVAKHGNRSATSKCGSADVLEVLGVNIEAAPECVGRCIDEAGIGFLYARALHPAMKHAAGPRRELGVRTVFNILGPITNPAKPCGQVVGVYDRALVEPIAKALQQLGLRHAFVASGSDGLDELTLGGPSYVAEACGDAFKTYEVRPEELGLTSVGKEAVLGGDGQENAAILRGVLSGNKGPQRDIVLLNAAPAIIAGQKAEDWSSAVRVAAAAIDSGAAMACLEKLIRVSHDS